MRIALLLLVSNVFVFASAIAQDPIPVKKGSLYGFENAGKTIIAPQFSYATHFRDGLALVQHEGKWGYINVSGGWVIPASYDAAQVMVKGKAVVFQNGKMGLVSDKGKVLLEPIYDSIKEGWDEGYIYKDGLQGLCDSSWKILIQPNYKRVSTFAFGQNCQRVDGKWDVFVGGKLLGEGLTRQADSDYIYNTNNIVLEQNGKVGIYDVEKGWVVMPQYDTIYHQDFYDYMIGNHPHRFLYILDYEKRPPSNEFDGTRLDVDRFRVAYADGRLVADRDYNAVHRDLGEFESDTVFGFQLLHEKGTTFLSPKLYKRELPYKSIERHRDWYIGTLPYGKQDILRPDLSVLASYASVRHNMVRQEVLDNMDQPYMDDVPDFYSYALLVAKETTNPPTEAVFHLKEGREISPFLKDIKLTTQMEGSTDTDGFIYSTGNASAVGFYFPGMEKGTALEYSDVNFLPNKRVVATKAGKRQLLVIQKGQLNLVASEKEIIHNHELIGTYYEPETESTYPSQPDFSRHFLVLRDANGKLGIVSNNNEVIPCQFDSIFQNASMNQYVDAKKDGKYTTINVETGEKMFGSYEIPLTLMYNDSYNYYYALVEQGDSSYFVDKLGKFYSTGSEYSLFKEKGRMGVQAYPEFPNMDNQKVVIIPPVFKSITDEANDGFLTVKNTDGLYGVINPRGDTIIPIIYKEMKFLYLQFNEAASYQTKTDEGVGLASVYKGVIVPAIFDSWEEYYAPSHNAMAILVRKGNKRGLYSYDGEELLPCIYDEIAVHDRQLNNDDRDKLVIVKKDGKWWVYEGRFGYGEDQFGIFGKWTTSELSINKNIQGPFDFILMGCGYTKDASGKMTETNFYTEKTKPAELNSNGLVQFTEGWYVMYVTESKLIALDSKEEEVVKTLHKPQFSYVQLTGDEILYIADKGEVFYIPLYGNEKNKRYKLSQW